MTSAYPWIVVRAEMKSWQQLPGVDRSGWEETVLLAAELADDRDRFVDSLAAINLPLAGQCEAKSGLSQGAREKLARQLLARMREGRADLRARIAAGSALGDLNALEVLGYERINDERGRLIAWRPPLARIPEEIYTFGSLDDPEAYDDETRFEQELKAFEIGLYPVTNAEWGCFIAAEGYTEPRWWVGKAARAFFEGRETNEGQAQTWIWWKQRFAEGNLEDQLNETYEPELQDRVRNTVALSPNEWDSHLVRVRAQSQKVTEPLWWRAMRYNNPLQPVVGVSFFEAAARGLGPHPRIYAYGDRLDGDACNIREASAMVGAPTPVGLYEAGRSSDTGVYDLTGNTWDWTRSVYRQTPPYDTGGLNGIEDASKPRVLRGGSWNDIRRDARAAYRYNSRPGNRDSNIGCRVCCVPLES